MNIAYTLARLSAQLNLPTAIVPVAWTGADYPGAYEEHVAALEINQRFLVTDSTNPTAKAIILTDPHGDQFTAFYSAENTTPEYLKAVKKAGSTFAKPNAVIIAPDTPDRMLACSQLFPDAQLKVWCPGQYTYALSAKDIDALMAWGDLAIVNRGELNVLWPGVDPKRLPIEMLIQTAGAAPVYMYQQDDLQEIAVPPVHHPKDPTGCGDAFTAGVVLALVVNRSATEAVSLGITQAQLCLQCVGGQAH